MDIHHGFYPFFLKFEAGMSKYDSFKIYQLSFFKHNIYNCVLWSNNYYLSVFVSLLDSQTWFLDSFFAGVDSLSESDDAIFICKV